MENEQIKLAFSKVKEDINNLFEELLNLKSEISDIKTTLNSLNNALITTKTQNLANFTPNNPQTDNTTNSTHNTTNTANTTHNTTVPQEIEGLKYPNLSISTGNEGVSTDRQTDTTTDVSTHNLPINNNKNIESDLQEASEILNSLDRLKKEIRLKFKRVTTQEMAVFSTIYQLEEQDPTKATYKQIATNLHLSESSIRDYVQRMINKGIPIKKQKINNRQLILSISQDLKQIATLSTILQLREL
jgi:hypothetical protein